MPFGSGLRRLAPWALRATGPLVLAFLLVRVVDYAELRDVFREIQLPWALAALAAVQLAILLRTFRWIEIHEAFGLRRASLAYQLRLTYATNLATLVLPQILNPFSRFVLLLQDGYRARRAAAGSVLEKALELAAYVGFGLYGSVFLASTFGGLVWWAVGVAVVALAIGVGLYVGRSRLSPLAAALIEKIPGFGEGAEGDPAKVAQDVVSLRVPVWVRLFGWSLVIALTQATMLYFLSRSLGVGLSYPFMVAAWGVVALSMLLPLTINGIGTREAILVAAFNAVDRSADAAVALGLLLLGVVAVGSSPGAIEWLRRSLTGAGRATAAEGRQAKPVTAPPAAAHPQGEGGQ